MAAVASALAFGLGVARLSADGQRLVAAAGAKTAGNTDFTLDAAIGARIDRRTLLTGAETLLDTVEAVLVATAAAIDPGLARAVDEGKDRK
jgi:uncharacterized protein (DUF1778 family)